MKEKITHCISLNYDDSQRLKLYAKICGITQSQIVSTLINNKTPKPMPDKRFWELMNKHYAIQDSIKENANGNEKLLQACIDLDKWVLEFQNEMLLSKEAA